MPYVRCLETTIPPVKIDIGIVFVCFEPLVFQSIVEDVFSLWVTLANYLYVIYLRFWHYVHFFIIFAA